GDDAPGREPERRPRGGGHRHRGRERLRRRVDASDDGAVADDVVLVAPERDDERGDGDQDRASAHGSSVVWRGAAAMTDAGPRRCRCRAVRRAFGDVHVSCSGAPPRLPGHGGAGPGAGWPPRPHPERAAPGRTLARARATLLPRPRRAPQLPGVPNEEESMAMQSVNPATGEVVATFEELTDAELDARLERAEAAFRRHRRTSFAQRAERLARLADLLEGRAEELGRLMTEEMGKPIGAAVAEAKKCALACRYYVEHGEAHLADEPVDVGGAKAYIRHLPIGPVLAIMPWNFPFWQVI